jgi:hypothetical protein
MDSENLGTIFNQLDEMERNKTSRVKQSTFEGITLIERIKELEQDNKELGELMDIQTQSIENLLNQVVRLQDQQSKMPAFQEATQSRLSLLEESDRNQGLINYKLNEKIFALGQELSPFTPREENQVPEDADPCPVCVRLPESADSLADSSK